MYNILMPGIIYKPKLSLIKYGKSINKKKGGYLYGGIDEGTFSDSDDIIEVSDEPYSESSEHSLEDTIAYQSYVNKKKNLGEKPKDYNSWKSYARSGRKRSSTVSKQNKEFYENLQNFNKKYEDQGTLYDEESDNEFPSIEPYREDEFYFQPKDYSDDIDDETIREIDNIVNSQQIYDIDDDNFIPDQQGDYTIYHSSVPKRRAANLGDIGTSTLREFPDEKINIDDDDDDDDDDDNDDMYTKPSELTIETYQPDDNVVIDDDGNNYEFKPVSDRPMTMSITEGVTVGDKLKPVDYIRPIEYSKPITIGKNDDKDYFDKDYDYINRPDGNYDSKRGSVSNLFEERRGYSNEVQDEINLLSIKKDNTQIIGSASYAVSSRYASDLDFFENVDVCCSKDDAIQVFLTGIQQIVKNVLRTKYHWFIEVKLGLDERYPEYVGFMDKGKYIIDENFEFVVNDLIVKRLIYEDESHILEEIFSKSNPNQFDFEMVMKIMREHRVLRWSAEEIISAYKLLPGGIGMNLRDAIPQKSQINIEVAAIVDGRLIQISNFFILSYHSKKSNKRYVINLSQESVDNIEEFFVDNLRKNIYTLLKSKIKYDPLKAAKRMFSLSRYTSLAIGKEDGLAKKVLPLLTSNYALAGQIKSEIGVMLVLLQEIRVNNFPYNVVRHQLDSYKGIISSFIDMPEKNRRVIISDLSKIIQIMKIPEYLKDDEKALIITLLDNITSFLMEYATKGAEKYLKNKKLVPLPKSLLPKKEDRIF